MLLTLAVCSLNRQYLILVTVCSLCKRAWSLLVESVLVPAVIPDLDDNWNCCAAARRLFEIRAVAAIFVSVPGNYLRPGHFLQSPCCHRDFERLALFTASLILICIEMWPRLTLCLPSLYLCLFCETTAHCSQSLRSLCVSLQVQYCSLLYHVLVPRCVPFAVCILRFGRSSKFAVDCTVHGLYAAAYFRIPILYCGTVSRSGFSYFVPLTTRFPTSPSIWYGISVLLTSRLL